MQHWNENEIIHSGSQTGFVDCATSRTFVSAGAGDFPVTRSGGMKLTD